MLALNEGLQKAGKKMWFCEVKYSLWKAVSKLLNKKANVRSILSYLLNILYQAAKRVNQTIVGVEIRE